MPGNRRILVVDDEEVIADIISATLRKGDYEVETFYDARMALARARDFQPDFLISDINMPEMDGFTLAKAVRELYPECKIVFISGNLEFANPDNFRADGLAGAVLLSKPFPVARLLPLLASACLDVTPN